MATPRQALDSVCLCIHLRRAAQRVTDFYDRMLLQAGISVSQYSLLINISRMEGCGTGELAKRVGLEKSTLVRTLQPLLNAGYVIDGSPDGSRKRQLYLSAPGREVLDRAVPLWEKAQSELRHVLGGNCDELLRLFGELEAL